MYYRIYLAMILLSVSLLMFTGCSGYHHPDGLYAELRTNKGVITIRLDLERTPMTAANFVGLAEGTIQNAVFPKDYPYYDGSVFHRVVPGHVIQAGRQRH